jgi:RNA methyltransferase, TrmH family
MNTETITSRDNTQIKHLKKLKLKKYRKEYNEFFIENLVIISDALEYGVKPKALFVSTDLLKKHQEEFDVLLEKTGLETYTEINASVNSAFSNLKTPSGICAIYNLPNNDQEIDTTNTVIYLNDINNPGNLGTILRSALAFGLKNIVIDEKCADLYNPKTINAGKEAIFKLNIIKDNNLEKLKEIKKSLPIVSSRLEDSKGVDILKSKICLVIGNESRGVDKEIQDLSDDFVKIEMTDNIESLNVSAAAAILFYNLFKS